MKILFRAEVDTNLSSIHENLLTKIEDKWYAIGNYNEIIRNDKVTPQVNVYDKRTNCFLLFFIKEETKAIHFEDTLDKEDTKIFASFSEDGKGGDVTLSEDNIGNIRKGVFLWHRFAMTVDIKLIEIIKDNYKFKGISPDEYKHFTKVIGVQK